MDSTETTLVVKGNELRFVFNKYSPTRFQVAFKNIKAGLKEFGHTVSKNGDYFTAVFKKAEAKRWNGIFSKGDVESNLVICGQDKTQEKANRISKSLTPKNKGRNPVSTSKVANTRTICNWKAEQNTRAKSSNITPNDLSELDFSRIDNNIEKIFTDHDIALYYNTERARPNIDRSIDVSKISEKEYGKPKKSSISQDILKRKRTIAQRAKVPLFGNKGTTKPVLPLKSANKQQQLPRVPVNMIKNQDLRNKIIKDPKKARAKDKAISEIQLSDCEDKSFQDFAHGTEMNLNRREDITKINSNNKEILSIFDDLKLDVNWVNREINMISKANNKYTNFIDFQHKVIKILSIKLKAERNSRFTAEQQFDSLMKKFAAQQEFIDKGC